MNGIFIETTDVSDDARDAQRYRFLRMPEPEMTDAQERASAALWQALPLKGNWGAKMDALVDQAIEASKQ